MAAQTYEQHKAAVDAAHPTPVAMWRLASDDPAHDKDDYAVAVADIAFNGVVSTFEVHVTGQGSTLEWSVHLVPEDTTAQRYYGHGHGRSWASAIASFATKWATECERLRTEIATELYARDLIVNQGITYGVVNLSALAVGGPSQAVVALSPEFDSDTLAYTASTSFANVAILAVAPDGATVTYEVGEASVEGPIASLDLSSGDNVITITVSRFEYTPTTYTLTITRPEG